MFCGWVGEGKKEKERLKKREEGRRKKRNNWGGGNDTAREKKWTSGILMAPSFSFRKRILFQITPRVVVNALGSGQPFGTHCMLRTQTLGTSGDKSVGNVVHFAVTTRV